MRSKLSGLVCGLAVVAVAWLGMSHAQSNAQDRTSVPRVKWEYASVQQDGVIDDEQLNAMGNEGWELVTFVDQLQSYSAVFKRVKQ